MTTTAMTQAAHTSLIRRKPLDRGRPLRRTPLALQPDAAPGEIVWRRGREVWMPVGNNATHRTSKTL
jgi:hypothetical protein